MINIPRRKIYEKLSEFEGGMNEMTVLIRNEKNFNERKDSFKETYKQMHEGYLELKALLVLFIENRVYEKEEDFEIDIKYYIKNQQETNNLIQKNKNIKKESRQIFENTNNIFEKNKEIKTYLQSIDMYRELDKLNNMIPKLLEIRRDKMK